MTATETCWPWTEDYTPTTWVFDHSPRAQIKHCGVLVHLALAHLSTISQSHVINVNAETLAEMTEISRASRIEALKGIVDAKMLRVLRYPSSIWSSGTYELLFPGLDIPVQDVELPEPPLHYYAQIPKIVRNRQKRHPIPDKIRWLVLERDKWECHYCGKPLGWGHPSVSAPEMEHKTPWSQGGPDTPENLVAACESCNGRKLVKSHDAFCTRRPRESV